jgi:hypothetical protein
VITPAGVAEAELGEQAGQCGGCVTGGILGGLDQGVVHRGDRPTVAGAAADDAGNTTSSSRRAGFPLSAGVWWASIPTT